MEGPHARAADGGSPLLLAARLGGARRANGLGPARLGLRASRGVQARKALGTRRASRHHGNDSKHGGGATAARRAESGSAVVRGAPRRRSRPARRRCGRGRPHPFLLGARLAHGSRWSSARARRARPFDAAKALEPRVTKAIQESARTLGGELKQLEFRQKSLESIERKIRKTGDARISDALRYTIEFPTANYTRKVLESIASLEREGFHVRSKNYWKPGDMYQGVNCALSKGNVTIEVQFHTPESFASVVQIHKLYEEFRVIPTEEDGTFSLEHVDKARALFDRISEVSARIPIPEGWESIPDFTSVCDTS